MGSFAFIDVSGGRFPAMEGSEGARRTMHTLCTSSSVFPVIVYEVQALVLHTVKYSYTNCRHYFVRA